MKQRVKKAVIPVAGFGTRFLPATKVIPKEMLPVVDKPVIQYLVEEAVEAGIETIIFVINKNKHSIEDHFSRDRDFEAMLSRTKKHSLLNSVKNIHKLAEFIYISQDEPLGTGDAIMRAKGLVGNEPFAVFWADDIVWSETPAIGQLIKVYEKFDGPVLGLFKIPRKDTYLYGVPACRRIAKRTFQVSRLIEKPNPKKAPSTFASMGRYIITPEIFPYIAKTKKRGGEVLLPDALDKFIQENNVYGYEIEGTWYDCGSKSGFLRANIELALKRPDLRDSIKSILKNL